MKLRTQTILRLVLLGSFSAGILAFAPHTGPASPSVSGRWWEAGRPVTCEFAAAWQPPTSYLVISSSLDPSMCEAEPLP